MKTPLSLLNLWHQRSRTLVSTSGVTFALLLVFAQLGFQGAVAHTATNTLEKLGFDILLRSVNYAHLFEPDRIDRQHLAIALSTPGVEEVMPFWITLHNWQRIVDNRPASEAAPMRPIAIMAFDPNRPVFTTADIASHVLSGKLSNDNQLLIDRLTHAEYEPIDGMQFGSGDLGTEAEVAGKRFTISGVYTLGTGLAANGSAIVNNRGFARIVPWDTEKSLSLGLVRVAEGHDVAAVQSQLKQQYQLSRSLNESPNGFASAPLMVDVLSHQQALEAERNRWLWHTPIGLIFQLGVAISLIVGAAIVYMVLATDVAEKLPEYATLLAMGYSRAYLAGVVMTQAVLLSIMGFLFAWLLAELLYRLATNFSGIPLTMEPMRVVSVSLLGLCMCCFSGLLSLRKLWKAEPANLF